MSPSLPLEVSLGLAGEVGRLVVGLDSFLLVPNPLRHTDAGDGRCWPIGSKEEASHIMGGEDGEDEVIGGVEAEWVWIFWEVGDEEGGDGVKELVEEPGAGAVACPAGGSGSAGTWLAIATHHTACSPRSGPVARHPLGCSATSGLYSNMSD